jgi:hypothetical protein
MCMQVVMRIINIIIFATIPNVFNFKFFTFIDKMINEKKNKFNNKYIEW